jgi:tetratricopeptide (TPR) repeat protein
MDKLVEVCADYPMIHNPFSPEPAPDGFALIGNELIDSMDAKNMLGLEDYLKLGGIYLASKDFKRAAYYFELAGDSAVVRDDPRLLGANFSNTGVVYTMGPVKDRGFDFLVDALAIHRSLEDREAMAHNMRILAAIFANKIGADTAEYYLNECVAIDRGLEQNKNLASDLARLAFFQGYRERFEESMGNHAASLALYRDLDDLQGMASQLINVGRMFRELGQADSSRVYLEEALALANDNEFAIQQKTAIAELDELGIEK